MIHSPVQLFMLFLSVLIERVSVLENGLARKPPMGWMSWGYYMCADQCDKNPDKCLDEKLITSVADAFAAEGYREAGYEYIIIDDCWSESVRDLDGRLVPDRKRFPWGMKLLAEYIHSRDLKFGIYTSIGNTTCSYYPASRRHFETDVNTFAEWGVDYLKVDGCFVEEYYLDDAYINLGYWLNKTSRPMVYSCSWPYYKKFTHKHELDYNRIVPVCNLWRNFQDINLHSDWQVLVKVIKFFEQNALDFQLTHGPGHWHDPDMLIVGTNRLTRGQSQVNMAVWSMLSAPLIISCDMKRVSLFEKNLLLNQDIIAVAQDPNGVMAVPYKKAESVTMWVKPHQNGSDLYYTIAIVNLGRSWHSVMFSPKHCYGLNSTKKYALFNLFKRSVIRRIYYNQTILIPVPGEDVVMFKLSDEGRVSAKPLRLDYILFLLYILS